MDSVRVGRQLRALRRRQRLRQEDVARRAGVSRSNVGRAERGQGDRLRFGVLDRIAAVLAARMDVRLSWNGEALDRLLDADHAALVEVMVERLRATGWECLVEVSFDVNGQRGAVDVLALHRTTAIALVVEVKSVVPDLQAMLMTLDRKARLGRAIAAEQGWPVRGVGRLLVVGESRTSRRRVDAHAATFEVALPARAVAVRQWLREPTLTRPLAGLLFLSSGRPVAARHRVRGDTSPSQPAARCGRRTGSGSGPPSDQLPEPP